MPRLSRIAVRVALVHLVLGFTVGALLLAAKGGAPVPGVLWRLRAAHVEWLVVGWTVELAMGVAFWILPRFRVPPLRGDERPARLALALLNVGVWLVAAGTALGAPVGLAQMGRIAELGAAAAFAVHAWPRVRPPGAGRQAAGS